MRTKPSKKTKKEVWNRWKGKCAFCGIDIPVEQHHIIAKEEDPSLADDPNNLILLCSNHHSLTLKKKPDGSPVLSIQDIEDLKRSKFVNTKKTGFYFEVPQKFEVNLGSNICSNCPCILEVNEKPLIEILPQSPAYYVNEPRIYLYMRFFDEENNFIGGMFANHWVSTAGENWNIQISTRVISISNKNKNLHVKFEVKNDTVHITGVFYFDGIKIIVEEGRIVLPGNNQFSNNRISNCEVAFSLKGTN
jgi:hypothetical protein